MITNRYTGLKGMVRQGSFGRKLMYLVMYPKAKRKAVRLAKTQPLFRQIEIETINKCNWTCPFCPVSAGNDPRPRKVMTEELYRKIIDELAQMDYRDDVGLFSNNEPFLDKDIIERAKYAREKLPHAFLHLYTNGSLLTVEKTKEIMKYLDKMIIDNYNDALELNDTVKPIAALCEEDADLNRRIEISLRKQNEVLYTRGGQAPNNQTKKLFKMPCWLPSEQLIIRPDGTVGLCDNDALAKYNFGDLNTQSLKEVWYSKEHVEIRRKLAKTRKGITMCEYCDSFST